MPRNLHLLYIKSSKFRNSIVLSKLDLGRGQPPTQQVQAPHKLHNTSRQNPTTTIVFTLPPLMPVWQLHWRDIATQSRRLLPSPSGACYLQRDTGIIAHCIYSIPFVPLHTNSRYPTCLRLVPHHVLRPIRRAGGGESDCLQSSMTCSPLSCSISQSHPDTANNFL